MSADRRAAKVRRRAQRLKHYDRPVVVHRDVVTDWDLVMEAAAVGGWCMFCGGPTCNDDVREEHCDVCGWVCTLLADCACTHCLLNRSHRQ
jgi:hypothetical protein